MLKKWKKTLKFLSTVVFLLLYVTVDRYNRETIRAEKSKKTLSFTPDSIPVPTTDDRLSAATVKTIVGYSKEFRLRQEMNDRIDCGVAEVPRRGNTTSQWTWDRKLDIKLFSAYYDRRQYPYRYVRIIGLLPRNSTLYCRIWYEENNGTMVHVTQKAVVREIWSQTWGQTSRGCEEDYPSLISCLSPSKTSSPPTWVSFVDKDCMGDEKAVVEIGSGPPSNSLGSVKAENFLICVKPLYFTHFNLNTFREWLDINRRLGAERIVVYLTNSTRFDTSRLGDAARILSVKKFHAPENKSNCPGTNLQKSIWHRRKMEIIAYNDCFYSNLDRSQFLIPLDVDEIIVPKTGNNWFEAFRMHFRSGGNAASEFLAPENYASFSVRNAYFFSDYPTNALLLSGKPLPLEKQLPNTSKKPVPIKLVNFLVDSKTGQVFGDSKNSSIFDRRLRSYRLSPDTDSVKSFVRIAKTLSVFNHYTFHVLDDESDRRQYIFPENVFQLNHYRNSCDPLLIDGCENFLNSVVYDDSLDKFRNRRNDS